MFGINHSPITTHSENWKPTRFISSTVLLIRNVVTRFTHRIARPLTTMHTLISVRHNQHGNTLLTTATAVDATPRDYLRQTLNLFLSLAQFVAAALIFSNEFGDELFYSPERRNPLIVPADYTFSIWGFIFPASIAYGIYQALPQQRTNDLLRRIGFPTAFAFGCITLWSVATLFDPLRYTVPLFFGALGTLVYAVYQSSRMHRQLTNSERLLVLTPLSVYAAWCTVGTIANTSTSLAGLGYTDPIFSEQTWAVIMLVVGGMISSFMTLVTGGNLPYAAGIVWALVGIVVATMTERPNQLVAGVAGSMVVVVSVSLRRARAARRRNNA